MPETTLVAIPPEAVPAGSYGRPEGQGVVMRQISDRSLISVQTSGPHLNDLADAVRARFSVALPASPCLAKGSEVSFLWSGHLQWFAMAADDRDLLERMHDLRGVASVSDQSDARCIVAISGPKARDTLAKLTPIDLHPRAFKNLQTAATLFGHISGQITEIAEEPVYELMVFRSFAQSFWSSLLEAGAEYGIRVVR